MYQKFEEKKQIIPSTKNINSMLPKVLLNIESKYKKNPLNLIGAWQKIIGEKLAPMTKIVSFDKGILIIKVKSSTLYSLLNNYEKEKLLKKMQNKFSKEIIHKLVFKNG